MSNIEPLVTILLIGMFIPMIGIIIDWLINQID